VTQQQLPWPPREVGAIAIKLRELRQLLEHGCDPPELDEHRAWLARMLIIRATGYLEQSVIEVTRAYVDQRSGGLVRVFARSWMDRSRNPTPDALLGFIGRFDYSLQLELKELLDADDQLLRRDLAMLVDSRNKIAHGHNEGVRPRRALGLTDSAELIADWFILRFNPNR